MKRNNKRKEACFDDTECKAHQLELQGLRIGKSRRIIVKYEDLNDHERLRDDPLLQYICGRDDKLHRQGRAP